MNVLIADDDFDWRALALEWIEGDEETQHVTATPYEAPEPMLEAIQEGVFPSGETVVFLDIEFSNVGVNGLDTLKAMKDHADERVRNIPVIIYSRSDSASEVSESYTHRANSFVHKGDGEDQKVILLDTVKFWMQTAKLPA